MNILYNNKLLIGLSILVSIFVQGCMVGPNFERPEVEVAEAYLNAEPQTDSVINMRWWELFGDEQLDSLVLIGLENNKDLLIAAARMEEARSLLGVAKADMWPSFGYNGSAQRGNVVQGVPQASGVGNLFTVAPSMQWEIDFWGKYRRASQAAKGELVASQYGYRTIQIGLISEIASTYFALMDYNNRKDITLRTLKTRQRSLEIIQARYDEGIIPEIDLNQAQIQEAIAAANLPEYERLIKKTQHALALLLGGLPSEIELGSALKEQIEMPVIPTGIPSDILQRRPDVMQMEQLLSAQTSRIGMAQANRFPSISITGLLGAASTQLTSLTTGDAMVWSLSGSILGPIFEFGKNKRKVEAERFRTEQVFHDYEFTVLNAFREVEDALVENKTFGDELGAMQRIINASTNAARLSNLRYDKGVTSYLEVLENERSLFDAELQESELMQLRMNSYVKLYKSLGGGWISPDEEKAARQTEELAAE